MIYLQAFLPTWKEPVRIETPIPPQRRPSPGKPGLSWMGALLWLACKSAGAIDFGAMQLHSPPDRPLEAGIPLELDTGQELLTLTVGVAPAQTYERNGLVRPAGLDRLRFEVLGDSEGGYAVRITSPEAPTMPLSLLVEATWLRGSQWPEGRLVREYALMPQTAPGPEPQRVGAEALESYGPTQAADTLWALAERYRPPDVHTHQMMVAIFDANPRGFPGNMNGMYMGATLRIPEAVQARRLTVEEATVVTIGHLQAWLSDPARPAVISTPALLDGPGEVASEVAAMPAADALRDESDEAAPETTMSSAPDALQVQLQDAHCLLRSRDEQLQALRADLAEARAAARAADRAAAAAREAVVSPPPAQSTGLRALWMDLNRAVSRAATGAVLTGAGALSILGILAGFLLGRRRRAGGDPRASDEDFAVESIEDVTMPGKRFASAGDPRATMDIESLLDLARAYADMGDAAGARRTLRAVVEAGNDAERLQAEGLLAGLDSASDGGGADSTDDRH